MRRTAAILVVLLSVLLNENVDGQRFRSKLKEEKKKLKNFECEKVCPSGRRCVLEGNKEMCVCLSVCPSRHKPVCGSDGKKYENHCELHRAACVTNTKISIDWSNTCLESENSYKELCPKDKLITLNEKILMHFKKELQTQAPLDSLIQHLFRRRDTNDDGTIDQGELTSLLADYTMYEDMYTTLAACSVRDWMDSEDVNGDYLLDVEEFYSQYVRSTHKEEPTRKNKEEPTRKNKEEPTRKNKEEPTMKNKEEPTRKNQEETTRKNKEVPTKKDKEEPTRKNKEEPTTPESFRTYRPSTKEPQQQTTEQPETLTVEVFTEKPREPMAVDHVAYALHDTAHPGTATGIPTVSPNLNPHRNLFFAFGRDGIHVINPATLSLVRHITAVDVVNGTRSTLCTGSPQQSCTWGGAVNAANKLIYAADALGSRLIVIDIETFSVIEEIAVSGHPYNPQYVAALDEVWFTNWASSIQVLTEEEDDNGTINVVAMATKKIPHTVTPVHPRATEEHPIYGLHVVDSCHLRDEERFGYVTHLNEPGFHEVSLVDKQFTRFVNLSSHNCHGTYGFALSRSTGHAVVQCFTSEDGGQRVEIVVELKTEEVVAMTSVNLGLPHISPDGRFVVTFNDHVLSTLYFAYDGTIQIGDPIKSSLRLSDVAFLPRDDGYDVYVTSKDSSTIILLHTSPAGMKTINVFTNGGMPQKAKDWLHTRRSIVTGCEAFDRYLATPATAEDALVILDGEQQSVSGRIENVKGVENLVWVGGEEM